MKPLPLLLCLFCLATLLGKESAVDPTSAEASVTLDPMQVKSHPVSSYAFSFHTIFNEQTKRTRLIVATVDPNSDAADADLQPGDEIVSIDGELVSGMEPVVGKGTPLGRLFLNRPPGTPLQLEVVTHRTKRVSVRALSAAIGN